MFNLHSCSSLLNILRIISLLLSSLLLDIGRDGLQFLLLLLDKNIDASKFPFGGYWDCLRHLDELLVLLPFFLLLFLHLHLIFLLLLSLDLLLIVLLLDL